MLCGMLQCHCESDDAGSVSILLQCCQFDDFANELTKAGLWPTQRCCITCNDVLLKQRWVYARKEAPVYLRIRCFIMTNEVSVRCQKKHQRLVCGIYPRIPHTPAYMVLIVHLSTVTLNVQFRRLATNACKLLTVD